MRALILGALVAIIFLTTLAAAEIEEYVADVSLEMDGKSSVKLLVSFSQFTEKFEMMIFGRIKNFNATAPKPVACELKVSEISLISCLTNLGSKETLKLTFDSYDFIKVLDKKYYLSLDLSPRKAIKRFYAVVRLPEGTALASEERLPEGGTTSSDGRRIIVIWRGEELSQAKVLKFQLVFEQTAPASPPTLHPWQFVVVAMISSILPAYLVFRRIRKPKEIILSVLDEFERAVMDAIIAAGGKVNQRMVVQRTGLSKAKVSRVVKSLAARKLIAVERIGRTNILRLVKKKFEL